MGVVKARQRQRSNPARRTHAARTKKLYRTVRRMTPEASTEKLRALLERLSPEVFDAFEELVEALVMYCRRELVEAVVCRRQGARAPAR